MDLRPIDLTCPICEHSFSGGLLVGYDYEGYVDGHPSLEDSTVLRALLHVCPNCGFTGFEAEYREPVEPERREKVRGVLRALAGDPPAPATSGADRYRRAAVIAPYLGRSHIDIAQLYASADLCAKLDQRPEDEQRRARRKAIEHFEAALAENEVEGQDAHFVHFLLSELHLRSGRVDEAERHNDLAQDPMAIDFYREQVEEQRRRIEESR